MMTQTGIRACLNGHPAEDARTTMATCRDCRRIYTDRMVSHFHAKAADAAHSQRLWVTTFQIPANQLDAYETGFADGYKQAVVDILMNPQSPIKLS